MSQHIGADAEQLIQQRLRQVALENGSWEKIEDLQDSSKNCSAWCQRQLELTVQSDENCPIADSAPEDVHHSDQSIDGTTEADVVSLPDHSAAISRIQTDLNGCAGGVGHLFPLRHFALSLINGDLSIHALNRD